MYNVLILMKNFADESIAAIITGIFSLVIMAIPYLIKSVKGKEDTKMSKILNHPVHINIDEHIRNSKLIGIETVIAPGRTKLAEDFLQYAIECWREPCRRFAEDMQKYVDVSYNYDTDYNRLKVYTLAMEMVRQGRSYEQLMGWNIDADDYEAVAIFRDKFLEWNQDRIERVGRKISDISLIDDTYYNCELKTLRILECIDDYIYDMYKDGMYVLYKLNGELKGKMYKYHQL